jgi:hypothetical protein
MVHLIFYSASVISSNTIADPHHLDLKSSLHQLVSVQCRKQKPVNYVFHFMHMQSNRSEIKFCQLFGVHNRACGSTVCSGGGGAEKNTCMQLQIWLTTWIAWPLACFITAVLIYYQQHPLYMVHNTMEPLTVDSPK